MICGHGHEQKFKYPHPRDSKIIQMPYTRAKAIDQIPPYAPPPPCRLDIDGCINGSCSFPERARSYRFNHTRSIAEKEKEYTEVTKLKSCMNLRMIQVLIKCFERSTVERIEENSNDLSRCLFIRTIMQDNVNI